MRFFFDVLCNTIYIGDVFQLAGVYQRFQGTLLQQQGRIG
jgi:hypothetical protein